MYFLKSFLRKFSSQNTKDIDTAKSNILLSRLLHDLSNRFITIRAATGSIKKNLSSESTNHSVEKSLFTIDKVINDSMILMELTKAFSKPFSANKDFREISKFSMLQCINETIANFPYLSQNQSLLVSKPDPNIDFLLDGNPTLFKNIFYCVIKNGLFSVNQLGSGKISIALETNENQYSVCFKYPNNNTPACRSEIFGLGLPDDSSPSYALEFINSVITSVGGIIKYEYKPNNIIAVMLIFH